MQSYFSQEFFAGPLLFLIYISYVDKYSDHLHFINFADDMTVCDRGNTISCFTPKINKGYTNGKMIHNHLDTNIKSD